MIVLNWRFAGDGGVEGVVEGGADEEAGEGETEVEAMLSTSLGIVVVILSWVAWI